MTEYLLFVSAERKAETGPGSFRQGIGGGGGFEQRQHAIHIEVENDERADKKAQEEAMRIVQDYQDRLEAFRWESITSTRLFRLIEQDLHCQPHVSIA